QYGCNGGYNQVWFERRIEGVATTGTPLVNEGDHMCHNNYRGGNFNYNYETMWDCSSDTGNPLNWKQQYYVTPDRFHANYYWIETLNSNYRPSSYCLSSLGDKTWGSYIYVYACNSSLNQAWSGA